MENKLYFLFFLKNVRGWCPNLNGENFMTRRALTNVYLPPKTLVRIEPEISQIEDLSFYY
jgi:hypothetical protein